MKIMDIQRELKNDLTSIEGAIETQEGIYIPLKEVERMLINRLQQVKNNDSLHSVNGLLPCGETSCKYELNEGERACQFCKDELPSNKH